MGNPIVHFEINSSDPKAGAKFYADLLGWHVQEFPMPDGGSYRMADTHGGDGINGGFDTSESNGGGVIVYAEVPDVQAALDKAVSLGAKVAVPMIEVPDVVTFAQFFDPQGNRIGLVKGDGTQQGPGVSKGDGAPITWFEILGTDALALHKFYEALFGWKITDVIPQHGNYGHANPGERGIHGGVGTSQGAPVVTIYAAVDDLAKTLERAEALGATIVMQPMSVSEQTSVAAFRDPQGNMFGLVRGG